MYQLLTQHQYAWDLPLTLLALGHARKCLGEGDTRQNAWDVPMTLLASGHARTTFSGGANSWSLRALLEGQRQKQISSPMCVPHFGVLGQSKYPNNMAGGVQSMMELIERGVA